MTVNWADVLRKLLAFPPDTHRLRPPCSEGRLEIAEQQLGTLPTELVDLLKHLNGARLFDTGAGGEMVALFGLSEVPPLPPMEWAEDWYIDIFTPKWRAAGANRQLDWVIAMMNYGGLIVLDGQGTVREWDTSQQIWDPNTCSFDQWIQDILREGEAYLNEQ